MTTNIKPDLSQNRLKSTDSNTFTAFSDITQNQSRI